MSVVIDIVEAISSCDAFAFKQHLDKSYRISDDLLTRILFCDNKSIIKLAASDHRFNFSNFRSKHGDRDISEIISEDREDRPL